MERIVKVISLNDLQIDARIHWMTRTPEERVAEVDRLRKIYISGILGKRGASERLRRVLRVDEPAWR